jgi:hypothetical protein
MRVYFTGCTLRTQEGGSDLRTVAVGNHEAPSTRDHLHDVSRCRVGVYKLFVNRPSFACMNKRISADRYECGFRHIALSITPAPFEWISRREKKS